MFYIKLNLFKLFNYYYIIPLYYYSARTRTPVRFISIEIGCFHQRLSESSRMAVRELYAFTKQVKYAHKSSNIKWNRMCSLHLCSRCFDVISFDNKFYYKQEVSLRVFRARLLKLAELASFHIFTRRNDSDWDPPSNDNYNITKTFLKVNWSLILKH